MAEGEWPGGMVTEECLQELLDFFLKSVYKARTLDRRYEVINKRCIHLVGRDYKISIIDNKLGQLCAHYPSEIIVFERKLEIRETGSLSRRKNVNDISLLRELIPAARFARCRSRFVVPVMLYLNKNICRSSTLSTMAELYGRSGFDWILTSSAGNDLAEKHAPSPSSQHNGLPESSSSESDWVLLNKVRGQDVQLLKALGVDLICDLMVEKKKLKYGIYVCSSEKVDKWARYSEFSIASMPYPGCEFFKEYRDNGYNAVALKFDWKQTFVDADLTVPDPLKGAVDTPYHQYQEWDLIEITGNYLKMLLHYLTDSKGGGILVHCISGWDRTPLFISLLRLSLWADDEVHSSLSPSEILYLTLAYDWLIYGHQLKERHDKGEEVANSLCSDSLFRRLLGNALQDVLYFCFDFLKYITEDDFSTHRRQSRLKTPSTEATPTNMTTSTTESSRSFFGVGHKAAELQPFDVHPLSPLGEAYELGESWVGVSSVSSINACSSRRSDSSSTSPEHRPIATDSWQQFSPDTKTTQQTPGNSRDASHEPSMNSHLPSPSSSRAKKLNCVRELFLKIFRTSTMDIPVSSSTSSLPSGGGALAGFTGLLSKLASSVINN